MVVGRGVRKVVLESLEEGWEEKVGRKAPMPLFLNLPKLWANTGVDESHGGGGEEKERRGKAKTLYLTSHTLYGQHLRISPLLSSFHFPLPNSNLSLSHTHTHTL